VAYRIESGRLDRAERTAAGGLRVPAAIGRSGVLVYRKADGSEWREYRPPEEAFAAASLATLRGAPVTDLHPPRPVTPESYRSVARGHVGDDPRADDDGKHIAASLYVLDADLIRGIEARERTELSAGYEVDLDLRPGTTPEGERFDAVQTNIRYNHVAVGPAGWGRAGSSVALRLDDALDVLDDIATDPASTPAKETLRMKTTIRVDGVEYVLDVDETAARALPAGLAREQAEAERLRADLAAATARADAAEAARDEAKGRADSLEAEATKAADPAVLSALVAARVELETKARALAPEVKCDGLTDREVMAAACGVEAKDRSDDYIRGRFEAAVETATRADGSLIASRIASAAPAGRISVAEAARRRMIERNRSAGKV